jgi:hypothetical protein
VALSNRGRHERPRQRAFARTTSNDAEFREREAEIKRRYRERQRAIAAGEAITKDAALVRDKPADPLDRWIRLWRDLNSESEWEESRARKAVKEEMEHHLETTRNQSKHEARSSEFGLADDF